MYNSKDYPVLKIKYWGILTLRNIFAEIDSSAVLLLFKIGLHPIHSEWIILCQRSVIRLFTLGLLGCWAIYCCTYSSSCCHIIF